jgi:hypothetical protein
MFGKKDLEPGEAAIVERHIKHHGGGIGVNNLDEWVADVRPHDGEPFRAVIPLPNLALDFREPDAGDVVAVLIDRKTRAVHFDKSDPRLSLKAQHAAADQRFTETLGAGPTDAGALAPPGAGASLVGFDNVHVVDGADAASLLQAILSGDGATRDSALADARQIAHGPGVADRLAELDRLRDAGALSPEEHAAQRQRIISAI